MSGNASNGFGSGMVTHPLSTSSTSTRPVARVIRRSAPFACSHRYGVGHANRPTSSTIATIDVAMIARVHGGS